MGADFVQFSLTPILIGIFAAIVHWPIREEPVARPAALAAAE